jgi:hypothetical protein
MFLSNLTTMTTDEAVIEMEKKQNCRYFIYSRDTLFIKLSLIWEQF